MTPYCGEDGEVGDLSSDLLLLRDISGALPDRKSDKFWCLSDAKSPRIPSRFVKDCLLGSLVIRPLRTK